MKLEAVTTAAEGINECVLVAYMCVCFPRTITLQKLTFFCHSFLLRILTTQIPWYCSSGASRGFVSFIYTSRYWNPNHEPCAFAESRCPLGIWSCPCISVPSCTCVPTYALSPFYSVSVAGKVNVEEGQICNEEVLSAVILLFFFSIPAGEKYSKVLHLWL